MSPKSTPKRTPEDQNDAPKRYWISGSILASILSNFGVPKGLPKGTQNRSKIVLGAPKPPKGLQGASRDPPGGLQGAILASFWEPRELIFEPLQRLRGAPEAPKSTPEAPKRTPIGTQKDTSLRHY